MDRAGSGPLLCVCAANTVLDTHTFQRLETYEGRAPMYLQLSWLQDARRILVAFRGLLRRASEIDGAMLLHALPLCPRLPPAGGLQVRSDWGQYFRSRVQPAVREPSLSGTTGCGGVLRERLHLVRPLCSYLRFARVGRLRAAARTKFRSLRRCAMMWPLESIESFTLCDAGTLSVQHTGTGVDRTTAGGGGCRRGGAPFGCRVHF